MKVKKLRPIGCALVTLSALLAGLGHAQAAQNNYGYEASGNVIDDYVLYNVGGGSAVAMGKSGSPRSLGVGVGWNSNLMCGNMSLTSTLQNQLNGATSGFQTIMSNVIQSATGAVASLPALIIQRANPALYNLLSNGILQARVDFDRSQLTCRSMGEKMANAASEQMGWTQIAQGQAMKQSVEATGGDAVASVTQADATGGDVGVPWIGGTFAGGSNQQPIRIVADVTKAGYNLLHNRAVDDTSPISESDCEEGLICGTWASPEAATSFAVRVLGEEEQRTCKDCTRTTTRPGVGLTPLIQESYETKLEVLRDLIRGNTNPTLDNLRKAGTSSVPITRRLIEALREDDDQDVLTRRLASEVALSDVVERGLLLFRLLLAGAREPNATSISNAVTATEKQQQVLQQELSNLKQELDMRNSLAGNAAKQITERSRERSEGSRGVFQGDPIPDRVRQVEKGATE
ncbi:integrating conjugative element protein [Pseudomonas caricapapayae]|nr:integrating conjugative element protein [Pseudomonas caricapapayae]